MRRAFVRTIALVACAGCSAGGAFPVAGDAGDAGTPAEGGFIGLGKGDSGTTGDGGTVEGCGVAGEKEGKIGANSRLNLEAKSADGKWYLGSGLKLKDPTTVVGADSVPSNTVVLASVGSVCGVAGIAAIPKSGFMPSVSVEAGHGYVAQLPDATYVRFYVKKLGTGADPEIDVRYEYPFTACPAGHEAKYVTTYPSCRLILDGRTQSVGQTDGPSCVFPMVGCSGNAMVEAWGGGGSGGSGCISFNGGSGGGGGGGGGYGKITAMLTAGEFYVARVGTGGTIASGAPSCPTSNAGEAGNDTSFTSASGTSLLTSGGGQGGGGGGASGGVGAMGGSSTASTNATGIKGSDGESNNGKTLCGGAGSMGPGGGGGAGGNGGTGGAGGCAPGNPGVPGGGGSGSSQGGLGKDGAAGQVTVTW